MVKQDYTETIEVPEGLSIKKEHEYLIIEGPKGQVKRKFDHPKFKIELKGDQLILKVKSASKKEKAVINSYKAHIKNAIQGTQEPFVYRLKICSGHFPMNVSLSGNMLIIKNFLGEKVPRKVKIKEKVTVRLEGNEIVVECTDKELCGQVAADIEQTTRRPGFDKRIFQDGIYIIEKAGKKV